VVEANIQLEDAILLAPCDGVIAQHFVENIHETDAAAPAKRPAHGWWKSRKCSHPDALENAVDRSMSVMTNCSAP
jgi:hypothetical protein